MQTACLNFMRSRSYHFPRSALLLASAVLCLLQQPAAATEESVVAKLSNGLTVSAYFHKGLPNRPAVLILHGFLQTAQSPPMSALAANLASKGYTVLSPTISLGVNRRNQSMACQAVHTHTVPDDVAEIAYWMKWLDTHGFKNIVSIGFSSTGNFEAMLYNLQGMHPAVKRTILVSLNPISSAPPNQPKQVGHDNAAFSANEKKLAMYSLGYCNNNYTASSQSYASYAQYNETKTLALVNRSPVPLDIILGSIDSILPPNWAATLQSQGGHAHLRLIDNANHFFDDTAEFDLAEAVESILKNIPGP